ncbi:5'-nucleotidase [Micromonospora pattaloongensis]|uniref:5'-nucleotidase n=1 Tax=Micromonospora pattaloongensis TaxID=405436 RepID=A0A1H3RT77_9ACTN|nr:5'/3'-nucleotidase SurE [Micromonospora pattaloongensis]SDZ28488.1 5'-nucleotidase [Micromonospora pattaloongensis]
MNRSTRVLITNDDGIGAPGIRYLARAAVEHGLDVVVAAPATEASGMSAAMTAVTREGRVGVRPQELADLTGTPAYGVDASPAYIVVLASLGAFGPPPELVLSGINRGANAGHAVLHSGTVGAALTAAGRGYRAMAVSLDVVSPAAAHLGGALAAIAALDSADDDVRHWSTAAGVARDLIPALLAAPARTVLNLNVPDVAAAEVRGVRRAALADFGQVEMAIAEAGEGYLRTSIEENGARLTPGTDLALLADGYAAVTPLRPVDEAAEVELAVPSVTAYAGQG